MFLEMSYYKIPSVKYYNCCHSSRPYGNAVNRIKKCQDIILIKHTGGTGGWKSHRYTLGHNMLLLGLKGNL